MIRNKTITVGTDAFESLPVIIYGYGDCVLSPYMIYKDVRETYLDDPNWSHGRDNEAAWALCNDSTLRLFDVCGGLCSTGVFGNRGMTDVEEIVINEGIEEISENSFKGMSSVKRIKIGPDVRTIGKEALFKCKNLYSVYFSGNYSSGLDNKFLDNSMKKLLIFHAAGDSTWEGIDVYNSNASSPADVWIFSSNEETSQYLNAWINAQNGVDKYPVLSFGEVETIFLNDITSFTGAYGLKYDLQGSSSDRHFVLTDCECDGTDRINVPGVFI